MSGTIQASVLKDSASATSNLALDASGNVTVGNNLTVTGTSTFTGGFAGALTAPAFIPSGSTVPANGMYLSAANTLNLATNTTNQVSISSTGIVTGTAGNLMLVSGTAVSSTSGTSIDFTGIPSWVKRITVMFNGVSTSGTSVVQVQIGSGSFTTTGYDSRVFNWTGGSGGAAATSGFVLEIAGGASASNSRIGAIELLSIAGNTWIEKGIVSPLSLNGAMATSAGALALGGPLDRVRITTVNGTDTFDAGTINILYE
jgi:hypothetical protein